MHWYMYVCKEPKHALAIPREGAGPTPYCYCRTGAPPGTGLLNETTCFSRWSIHKILNRLVD
jgi:hypothetical protein